MSSGGDHFLLRHRECVQEGLHRGFTEAPTALMWPRLIVLTDPQIKIGLQFIDRMIHVLAERDTVELVQHGLVEAFADTIGLRAPRLGARVVDISIAR